MRSRLRGLQRVPLGMFIVAAMSYMSACHRGAVSPVAQFPLVPKGKVLILPPRDIVQGGGFHPISPGSGSYFLAQLRPLLEQKGWTLLSTDNGSFSNTSIPDMAQAVREGRRVGADYVLKLVLGEFRDAAPMTFRPDYVTLQSAELWSTKNGALVWSISTPLVDQGANLRDYHRLLDELAEMVADSMSTAHVDPFVFSKPDALDGIGPANGTPTADDPATASPSRMNDGNGASLGTCTLEQVLAMKNAGMNDGQVKKACAPK